MQKSANLQTTTLNNPERPSANQTSTQPGSKDPVHRNQINANLPQAAILNKMLPKGWRLEFLDKTKHSQYFNNQQQQSVSNSTNINAAAAIQQTTEKCKSNEQSQTFVASSDKSQQPAGQGSKEAGGAKNIGSTSNRGKQYQLGDVQGNLDMIMKRAKLAPSTSSLSCNQSVAQKDITTKKLKAQSPGIKAPAVPLKNSKASLKAQPQSSKSVVQEKTKQDNLIKKKQKQPSNNNLSQSSVFNKKNNGQEHQTSKSDMHIPASLSSDQNSEKVQDKTKAMKQPKNQQAKQPQKSANQQVALNLTQDQSFELLDKKGKKSIEKSNKKQEMRIKQYDTLAQNLLQADQFYSNRNKIEQDDLKAQTDKNQISITFIDDLSTELQGYLALQKDTKPQYSDSLKTNLTSFYDHVCKQMDEDNDSQHPSKSTFEISNHLGINQNDDDSKEQSSLDPIQQTFTNDLANICEGMNILENFNLHVQNFQGLQLEDKQRESDEQKLQDDDKSSSQLQIMAHTQLQPSKLSQPLTQSFPTQNFTSKLPYFHPNNQRPKSSFFPQPNPSSLNNQQAKQGVEKYTTDSQPLFTFQNPPSQRQANEQQTMQQQFTQNISDGVLPKSIADQLSNIKNTAKEKQIGSMIEDKNDKNQSKEKALLTQEHSIVNRELQNNNGIFQSQRSVQQVPKKQQQTGVQANSSLTSLFKTHNTNRQVQLLNKTVSNIEQVAANTKVNDQKLYVPFVSYQPQKKQEVAQDLSQKDLVQGRHQSSDQANQQVIQIDSDEDEHQVPTSKQSTNNQILQKKTFVSQEKPSNNYDKNQQQQNLMQFSEYRIASAIQVSNNKNSVNSDVPGQKLNEPPQVNQQVQQATEYQNLPPNVPVQQQTSLKTPEHHHQHLQQNQQSLSQMQSDMTESDPQPGAPYTTIDSQGQKVFVIPQIFVQRKGQLRQDGTVRLSVQLELEAVEANLSVSSEQFETDNIQENTINQSLGHNYLSQQSSQPNDQQQAVADVSPQNLQTNQISQAVQPIQKPQITQAKKPYYQEPLSKSSDYKYGWIKSAGGVEKKPQQGGTATTTGAKKDFRVEYGWK